MSGDATTLRTAGGALATLDNAEEAEPTAEQRRMVQILDCSPVNPDPLRREYGTIFLSTVEEMEKSDPVTLRSLNAEIRLEAIAASAPVAGQPVTVSVRVTRDGRPAAESLIALASVPRGTVSPAEVRTSVEGTATAQWTLPAGGDFALVGTLRDGSAATGVLPLHVPGGSADPARDQSKDRGPAPRDVR
jgi:hypothetical protein